jgi:penicillin V acylase-like amidase (Ntn superfamily)
MHHPAHPVHGANFDWHDGDGFIVVNKRGVRKQAVSNPREHHNPATWTSRYGSVTFNRYGCDLPWGGMNEAGLVCSTLLLDETRYPAPDSRPSVFILQYLQYQLDTAAGVGDVLASDAVLRIRPTGNGLGAHYFFSDRKGNCAVVEFLDGRRVAYSGPSMPVKALANGPYERCLRIATKYRGFGGTYALPRGNLSTMRFIRTAAMLKCGGPPPQHSPVDAAFAVLESAAYRGHRTTRTQWRIVFDINAGRIWYRTADRRARIRIDLDSVDFSCRSPIRLLPISSGGDRTAATGFMNFSTAVNRTMVAKLFRINPLRPNLTGERLERVTRYPETFDCQDPAAKDN